MRLERARESLRAAELCLEHELVNSAVSRAYYAMSQAAQVALQAVGMARTTWSHSGLQATFTLELIRRRKIYPAAFRDYLAYGMGVRLAADYQPDGVSRAVAHGLVRRAGAFVARVEEVRQRGSAG